MLGFILSFKCQLARFHNSVYSNLPQQPLENWYWGGVCVCMCACLCVCEYISLQLHMQARSQPEVSFTRHCPPCFMSHNLLAAWGLPIRLDWLRFPVSTSETGHPSHPFSLPPAQLFLGVLRIKHALVLARQSLIC